MTRERFDAEQHASDPELQAWLRQEIKHEVSRARWRDGRIAGGIVLGLALSIPLAGLALPDRTTFAAGEVIRASAINQNFEQLWTAVEALEGAADTLLSRDDADDRYGRKAPAPVAEGFFDPLNAEPSEVALAADTFTTVQTQSIEVPGPGTVVAIATAVVASTTASGAPIVWFGVSGDGESLSTPSTYAALTGGAPQSLTVHGAFHVDDAGTKEYGTSVLPASFAAVSRAAHMTLLFVPD